MLKKLFRHYLWLYVSGILVIAAGFAFIPSHLIAESQRVSLPPSFSISPNPASMGTTITLTGFRYPAKTKVVTYFQNRANGVVSVVTNAAGFFNARLKLPLRYIAGVSYVYVVVGRNAPIRQPLTFIKPSLTYVPGNNSSFRPTNPSVKGSGFAPYEHVSLRLGNGSQVGTAVADSRGNFTAPVRLPSLPSGSSVNLFAVDGTYRITSISVRSYPSIQVTRPSGQVGSKVAVSGSSFGRNEIVVVYFQGRIIGQARTNNQGSFATTFLVPSWAVSSITFGQIKVNGKQSGTWASASYQVLPSVSLSKTSGVVGQVIKISGFQFTPNGTVRMMLIDPKASASAVGLSLGSTTASVTSGKFVTQFTVPSGLRPGQYKILIIDTASGTNVSASFYLH